MKAYFFSIFAIIAIQLLISVLDFINDTYHSAGIPQIACFSVIVVVTFLLIQLFCRLRSYGTNNQLKQKVFNRYLLVYFVFMPM